MSDLVKLNVPCSQFPILVSPYLFENEYRQMIFYVQEYLNVIGGGLDPEYLQLEYLGNVCILYNKNAEPLMMQELDGEPVDEPELFMGSFTFTQLVLVDQGYMDMIKERYG